MKYGYIACKGRSPQEMKEQVTVAEGLKNELDFFKKNYPDLVDLGIVATVNLVNRLSNILGKNI